MNFIIKEPINKGWSTVYLASLPDVAISLSGILRSICYEPTFDC